MFLLAPKTTTGLEPWPPQLYAPGMRYPLIIATLGLGLALTALSVQAKAPRKVRTLKGHTDDVLMVSFGAAGKLLASASSDSVRLWRLPSGRKVAAVKASETDAFTAVALGPKGKHLASALGTKVRLMAVRGKKLVKRHEFDHSKEVSQLRFDADEAILVSAGADGVRVWDVSSGDLLCKVAENKATTAVGICPANGEIAVAHDGEIHLFNRKGKARGKVAVTGAQTFVYSADGKRLLVIGKDRKVHLINAADGKAVWSQGRVAYDTAVAFSPDGKLALTNYSDGKLKGLKIEDGSEAWYVKGSAVISVLAAGGKLIATPGANSRLLLWRLR
jgi:WD40 repeat protein